MKSTDGTPEPSSPDGTEPITPAPAGEPAPRRPRLTSVVGSGVTLTFALLILYEMPVVHWLERTGRRIRALTKRD